MHTPITSRSARRLTVVASVAALTLSLCLLSGCTGGQQPSGNETTGAEHESATEPTAAMTTYTVTVLQDDGTPASDIIVKLQKEGTEAAFKPIGATGTATFSLESDDYTVLLESPTGTSFHYDTAAAHLSAASPALTLTICNMAVSADPILAPSLLNDDYQSVAAVHIGEGKTYVPFQAGEYTYAIFTPTRGGQYEIRGEGCDGFTYHGMPIMVLASPAATADESGLIPMTIQNSSIGDGSVAQYVFRLNPPSEGADGCFITVTRTGDVPQTIESLPWSVPTADPAALHAYEGDTTGTLTNLDVRDPSLSVVLADDGYYHLGTADGPVVFLRLTSDSPYMEDFLKICETDRIRAYFYKEDGSFDYKESYNGLIKEYADYVNEDGLVPLNAQLAHMVQNAGRHMGWWNFEDNLDIFGDTVVPEATAWLFACAYYQA